MKINTELSRTANAIWTYFDGAYETRTRRLQKIYSKYLGAFGKGYGEMPGWILKQKKTFTNDYCNTILYLIQIQ